MIQAVLPDTRAPPAKFRTLPSYESDPDGNTTFNSSVSVWSAGSFTS